MKIILYTLPILLSSLLMSSCVTSADGTYDDSSSASVDSTPSPPVDNSWIQDMINTQNMINNQNDFNNTQNMINTQNMVNTQNMIDNQNMINSMNQ